MLPNKFQVNRPFDSGEEGKIRFSRWPLWQPSWISDRKDFGYFFLSTRHPDASYQVSSQLAFRFRRRDFQGGRHGSHPEFLIGTILAIFDLKVTPMLPTKFRVNSPFGSGEEVKTDFRYGHPDDSYQVSSQLAFRFRRGREK